MQAVQVEGISKRFDDVVAVDAVSLTVQPGEFFTLLGPSGCGKTTLLRLLAGLESPDSGAIWFGGERVDAQPAHLRNIGMVFQNYAVFPHMTVADNVAYGLRARRRPEPEVRERAAEALAQVQMGAYAARRPDQLSGGQQQRVALARALATRPAVLLMDEPLSNLDARLRVAMREEIRAVQRQVGTTTVYVTHDQEEALAISDRIGVMEGGRLIQVGSPQEIYRRPAHRFVAEFVGVCSFLDAGPVGRPNAVLGLRPEALRVLPGGAGAGAGTGTAAAVPAAVGADEALLPAVFESATFLGAFVHLHARLATGEPVTALALAMPHGLTPGDKVTLAFRRADALLFDDASGGALV